MPKKIIQRIAKIFLIIIAVVVIGYFPFMSYISSQMSNSSIKTWEAMNEVEFNCPPGLKEKTERWSKLGYSRSCVKPIDGKWEAWSEGYKHIDGFYMSGKKHGTWVFYNPNGSISKEIEYNLGKEVANKEIKN